MSRRVVLLLIVLCAAGHRAAGPGAAPQQTPSTPRNPPGSLLQTAADKLTAAEFARLSEHLSEAGGYFDTDNLISNEASYLHVLGALRRLNVAGGAYIGVGPDQNFSYIAQIRPQIAYIIDIRPDNLLQHLWFKSLFAASRNRIEYLALMLAKPLPENTGQWEARSIQQIVDYLDGVKTNPELFAAATRTLAEQLKTFGFELKENQLATIERIHRAFAADGLDLRFTSRNRAPRAYYPTLRDLLLERDLTGSHGSYLSSESGFRFLKDLQARNMVVPVVGDLGGNRALVSTGRDIAARGLRVSAFYTSNVEFYLMREGGFERFAENLKSLPTDSRSVIIRSYFGGGFGYRLPQTVPGYYSTQLLQTIPSLLQEVARGGYDSYSDLVTKHAIDLK
ncbi:MAG: hypothetical protein KIT57_04720 [Blastocatellales bacterium]|nr:hypothetical protein [Blastocatellales bacterium]